MTESVNPSLSLFSRCVFLYLVMKLDLILELRLGVLDSDVGFCFGFLSFAPFSSLMGDNSLNRSETILVF